MATVALSQPPPPHGQASDTGVTGPPDRLERGAATSVVGQNIGLDHEDAPARAATRHQPRPCSSAPCLACSMARKERTTGLKRKSNTSRQYWSKCSVRLPALSRSQPTSCRRARRARACRNISSPLRLLHVRQRASCRPCPLLCVLLELALYHLRGIMLHAEISCQTGLGQSPTSPPVLGKGHCAGLPIPPWRVQWSNGGSNHAMPTFA